MTVTVDTLRDVADQLQEALEVYDHFVGGWPYEDEMAPEIVEEYVAEYDADLIEGEATPGATLVAIITERYYEACEVHAKYVERVRARGCSDWSQVVTDTEPIRDTIRRVHTAGYGTRSETDECGYLLPHKLCPASLVSMNGGSSPVTFEDRVVQYRAVADRFDLSPEIVYHPGSGHDVSLSEAFPGSRVVYVDIDEAAMVDLNQAGYEAMGTDATAYELEKEADVIVFRNAGLMEEPIVEANLRTGGWVVANDHLESATHLMGLPSLDLVGVVPDIWSGSSPEIESVDSNSIDDHRRISETDRTGTNTESVQLFEQSSPLDLYVFRNAE